MQNTKFLVPAEGLKIRHPGTKQLIPNEGMLVIMEDYWWRRLRDGDVVEGKAPEDVKEASAKAPAKPKAE